MNPHGTARPPNLGVSGTPNFEGWFFLTFPRLGAWEVRDPQVEFGTIKIKSTIQRRGNMLLPK